jgi:hypothetical protein
MGIADAANSARRRRSALAQLRQHTAAEGLGARAVVDARFNGSPPILHDPTRRRHRLFVLSQPGQLHFDSWIACNMQRSRSRPLPRTQIEQREGTAAASGGRVATQPTTQLPSGFAMQ